MIPIYIGNEAVGGVHGLPTKNPIYFIHKALGKDPEDRYHIIVLNQSDLADQDLFPPVPLQYTQHVDDFRYDVEMSSIQYVYDQQVEPAPDRDGSIAGEPTKKHAIISLRGFIRADTFDRLSQAQEFLNYSFDPVINFLEGASTLQHTFEPHWTPFYNVGFGVLAWFDPTNNADWRVPSGWLDPSVDPFTLPEYERLNRMILVRSTKRPVSYNAKFGDMSAPFDIQLLATDPTIYEFIAPAEFGDHAYIDDNDGTEDIIVTEFPWKDGPGWRELTNVGPPIRLYHRVGNIHAALSDPEDVSAGWNPIGGISGVDYSILTFSPQNTINGYDDWSSVNAAAGMYFQAGFGIALSDENLLEKIQVGGAVRGQHLGGSRHGIGIDEGAQNNYIAMALRVYRTGVGFVATLLPVTQVGFTKLPALAGPDYPQGTNVNRSIEETAIAGYSGALSTDFLIVDYGVYHVGPTGGGTGAGIKFTDTAGSNDLPVDEVTLSSYNSWLEIV